MGAVSHGGTDARGFDKEFTRWTVPNVETLSGDKTITSVDARVQLLNPGGAVERTITLDASLHVIGTRLTIRNTEGWNGSTITYGALSVKNSTANSVCHGTLAYGAGIDIVYVGSGSSTGWQVISQTPFANNGSSVSYGTYTYFSPTNALYATDTKVGVGATPSSLFHVTASGDANAIRVDNTSGHVGIGDAPNVNYLKCLVRWDHATEAGTFALINNNAAATAATGCFFYTDAGSGGASAYLAAHSIAGGAHFEVRSYVGDVYICAPNTKSIQHQVNSITKTWISVDGFGIGGSPSSLFHVTAAGNANALRVDNTTGNTGIKQVPGLYAVGVTGQIMLNASATGVTGLHFFDTAYGIGIDTTDLVLFGNVSQGVAIKNNGLAGTLIARATATGFGIGASPSSLFHVTASGNANALRVDNTTGNIGIGAAPDASADVRVIISKGGTPQAAIKMDSVRSWAYFYDGSGEVIVGSLNGVSQVGTSSAYAFNIVTNGTSRIAISSVGIVTCPGTTGAFSPPVLTTAQRDALTAVKGMIVYNSTTDKHQGYNGAWTDFY